MLFHIRSNHYIVEIPFNDFPNLSFAVLYFLHTLTFLSLMSLEELLDLLTARSHQGCR